MDEKSAPVRRIGFVVSTNGAIVPWSPPPPARCLSRAERIDAYRAGIRRTVDALERLGFSLHYAAEHTASLEFRGYLFDFRIQRPNQVAHVGGTAGPNSTKGSHGGSIYRLSTEIKSEFALQMIIGKAFSAKPVYVDLQESLQDPTNYIYDAVMGFLAALSTKDHRLGKALILKYPELAAAGPKQLPDWIDI